MVDRTEDLLAGINIKDLTRGVIMVCDALVARNEMLVKAENTIKRQLMLLQRWQKVVVHDGEGSDHDRLWDDTALEIAGVGRHEMGTCPHGKDWRTGICIKCINEWGEAREQTKDG